MHAVLQLQDDWLQKVQVVTCLVLMKFMPSVLWRCWLGGRKGIRPGGLLAWLSVWSEMQTCMWPSWCHCHSLSLASVKSRLVLPFWYRLTCVVSLDKGPLNGCVCCSNEIMSKCSELTNMHEYYSVTKVGESAPRSAWWHSHMAGIYSDCRILEIIIIKVNELKTCVAVWDHLKLGSLFG